MTPERAAELVARWARLYTRGLPAAVAERRIEEIGADVQDHIAHERAHGAGDRRIAAGILSRMVRGLPADASWRRRHARATTVRSAAVRIALVTAFVLLIPLVAMQFSEDVVWGLSDFVFAGALIAGTGLLWELARRAGDRAYRAAVAVGLGTAFILVWGVAAVGVIGEDGDRADLMYGGVLAVGVIGAVMTRLRPAGMARVLVAMAFAQALVAVIALIIGKHEAPASSAVEILGLNGFFAALFIASAWLFRRAARTRGGLSAGSSAGP